MLQYSFDYRRGCALISLVALVLSGVSISSADQPQWGERHSRNMISPETGLPERFDLDTGEHVLWTTSLGGGSYGSPIVADGRVYIGANNSEPRDPRHQGDRGALLCLDARDGALLWQLLTPRIGGDDYLDWPGVGICSPPTVEGDRAYTVTNRGEVVCLDVKGLDDGNDGPFVDEGSHMTPSGEAFLEPAPPDADIIWLFDMRAEVGMYPHDAPFVSILLDGDFLYLNTGNGVDNTHRRVGNPDAPNLIVLNKHDGRLLARENESMGPRIFHAAWAPPSMGVVNGRKLLFFGGPDGLCYAFNALGEMPSSVPVNLEQMWRFDCDPAAPKENVHEYTSNTREGPSQIVGMPVFVDNRIYVTAGGDVWWGKRQSWLKCIDAAGKGDITDSGELWSYSIPRQSTATPAVLNGLVFVTDDAGHVHCVDAETGEGYWKYRVGSTVWGSALGADGRIFVGARSGEFAILAADKTLDVLFTTRFPDEINGTPTAANGTLYVATLSRLYALKVH